jgi:hypothetical protein
MSTWYIPPIEEVFGYWQTSNLSSPSINLSLYSHQAKMPRRDDIYALWLMVRAAQHCSEERFIGLTFRPRPKCPMKTKNDLASRLQTGGTYWYDTQKSGTTHKSSKLTIPWSSTILKTLSILEQDDLPLNHPLASDCLTTWSKHRRPSGRSGEAESQRRVAHALKPNIRPQPISITHSILPQVPFTARFLRSLRMTWTFWQNRQWVISGGTRSYGKPTRMPPRNVMKSTAERGYVLRLKEWNVNYDEMISENLWWDWWIWRHLISSENFLESTATEQVVTIHCCTRWIHFPVYTYYRSTHHRISQWVCQIFNTPQILPFSW